MKIGINKYKNWFIGLLLIGLSIPANAANLRCLQNQHAFGLIATSPFIDNFEQTLPPRPKLNADAWIQKSWLLQDLSRFGQHAKKPILDVGGGYGEIAHLVLKSGATVVYNDLDMTRLIYGRKLANAEQRQRLYLNSFDFPQGMIFKPNSFSAVVLHRIAHVVSQDRFEEGIAKSKRWLISGGKIYVAVLPAKHDKYSRMLEHYGFIIEREGFTDDTNQLYGIIAKKN